MKNVSVTRKYEIQDLKQLHAIYKKIETNVSCLQGLGIESVQYGTLFVPTILEKYPGKDSIVFGT